MSCVYLQADRDLRPGLALQPTMDDDSDDNVYVPAFPDPSREEEPEVKEHDILEIVGFFGDRVPTQVLKSLKRS